MNNVRNNAKMYANSKQVTFRFKYKNKQQTDVSMSKVRLQEQSTR